MKMLPFKSSSMASLGVELEFQLIDPETFHLISRAKDFIRNIKESSFANHIKPEITQSMIEINSSIHKSANDLSEEFKEIKNFLLQQAQVLDVLIAGGGTHPFQKWTKLKVFPTKRYKNLSRQFRYLLKRSTVFGQHVHIGCKNPEDAIYLMHALTRYIPHFIAISASSPFYQGIDTGFNTSRTTVFNAYPMSGVMPYLTTWAEFSGYYYKMRHLGIIQSMKDFYWDIRPKPEYGTVEIRVCDTPLTIQKAIRVAAYIQTIAHYVLTERPITLTEDLYYVYTYNRFQASRYGFDGSLVDAHTLQQISIYDDMLETINRIQKSGNILGNMGYISLLMEDILNKNNDAKILKEIYKEKESFSNLVSNQCHIWARS